MKNNRNILNEIVNQIDLLNTLNGGISKASVNIVEEAGQSVIKVHSPGVSKYAYHVEVINNMILIYTLLKVEKNEDEVQMPAFVRYFPIPANADIEEIHAVHEDKELKVYIPYKRGQSVKQRKINIDYL